MGLFKSDDEQLFDAVENGNLKKVKKILKNSNNNNKLFNLNKKNNLEYYPLLRAIDKNNTEMN